MDRNPVVTREVTVNLRDGLHLHPISQIVQVARQYACEIRIHKDDRSADARSPLDILTLGVEFGSVLRLEACGEQASEAVAALVSLFRNNFPAESNKS
jgi:phosphotransferase system HPr (HPr) family protein